MIPLRDYKKTHLHPYIQKRPGKTKPQILIMVTFVCGGKRDQEFPLKMFLKNNGKNN